MTLDRQQDSATATSGRVDEREETSCTMLQTRRFAKHFKFAKDLRQRFYRDVCRSER